MTGQITSLLKGIPKVDRILQWPEIAPLVSKYPRPEVLKSIRSCLDELRELIKGSGKETLPDREKVVALISSELARRSAYSLRKLVNGTGVVVHTNLGRSPLADEAETAIQNVSAGYSNLEFNLETGERGTRYAHVESLICELSGAEAALVVNNNAAAVILALSTLAAGREVIVSRGELVEIGGSFRIPDVMRQSGAQMVEVGTTNRTHIHDFTAATSDATALYLKVHTSNFAIVGFTTEVSIAGMASLGRANKIPVMLDAGSGCLIDLSLHGIPGEPTIRQYMDAGADLVTFSGDKLLGGPQAGIIAGKRDLVEPMKKHPLLRALRIDKLSLAALEATLRLYRDERQALRSIPTIRMLAMTAAELSARADQIKHKLKRSLPDNVTLLKQQGLSSAGGGSFPLLKLPTSLVEVRIQGASPQQIDAALRSASTPVIGRIHQEKFLLDARTILTRDLPLLADSIHEAATALSKGRS